jgi:hypothetical protein
MKHQTVRRALAFVPSILALALAWGCKDAITEPPEPPAARAGEDQAVAVASQVQLDGTGSTGTGVTLTWAQLSGPAVGALSGAAPTFTAPADVSTLVFELRVARGSDVARDTVRIWVLEDPANQYWVRPDGDDANPGTRAQPFASVQAAINAAHGAGRGGDVYVAAGTYAGSVELRPGVSVYGGFDPVSWLRDIAAHRPTIQGGPRAVAGQMSSGLTLEGLRIVAADATGQGGSSIALHLNSSSNVRVRDNVLEAGAGMAGQNGSNGAAGINGTDGSRGSNHGLCIPTNYGGAGGGQYVAGGRGGNGGLFGGMDGESGSGPVAGSGGAGGSTSNDGTRGSHAYPRGLQGGQGLAGLAFGFISSSGYSVASGGNGLVGGNGSGGGGGGGGGGNSVECGAGGGGGGGGGQGGHPGTRGLGGGGSFGIILSGTTSAEIVGNSITTGVGGAGGRGGTGGWGGDGGYWGAGGDGACNWLGVCKGAGGGGGVGTSGGMGGHGGGGGGGPSIGIAEAANASATLTGNTITIGEAGAGGARVVSSPGWSSGNPGMNGTAAAHLKL